MPLDNLEKEVKIMPYNSERMPFVFSPTRIKDVILIEPKSFSDDRGFFFENYKKSDFTANGIKFEFVQDNTSSSEKGVIRGMHFQAPPFEQGKLVRAVVGEILDVAIDIRNESPTYGQWISETLSSENKKMLWVPPGFAHGFLTLTDALVHYKVTNEYNKESEGGLKWNDGEIGIDWQTSVVRLSQKDEQWPLFKDFKSQFKYGGD